MAEMVETWDKNRNISQQHALFCEESSGKIDVKDIEPFRNSMRSMGEVGGGRLREVVTHRGLTQFEASSHISVEDALWLLLSVHVTQPSQDVLYCNFSNQGKDYPISIFFKTRFSSFFANRPIKFKFQLCIH